MDGKGPPLDDLKEFPPEKLDQPCLDVHLCEVALHVSNWLSLAPFLGISEADEKEIVGNWPRNTAKQKIDFFRKWRKKHGCKATYRRLCKVFLKLGEVALAEKVCNVLSYQGIGSNEGSEEESSTLTSSPPPAKRVKSFSTIVSSEGELSLLPSSAMKQQLRKEELSFTSLHHIGQPADSALREALNHKPPTLSLSVSQLAQEVKSTPTDLPTTSGVNSPLPLAKRRLVPARVVKQPFLQEIWRGIPPEKLDQPCLDEHLCEVAHHITDWPSLAPLMGMTRPEMEEVMGRWPKSVGGQRVEFLRKWQDKVGQMGTYRRLCESFYATEQIALVEKVCEILHASMSHTPKEVVHPLDAYAQYLREMYDIIQPQFLVLQWPPPPTHRVFNLAMIHTEDIQRASVNEELVQLLQKGNVAAYTAKKVTVQLCALFKLDKMKRKIILIEGAPGSGKSTLAWHICQKWKAQELFQKFKMVIFVQLRDPRVQSAQSIADVLPAGSKERRMSAAKGITACEGSGVLFVMDGWDEYGPGLETDSIVCKLICKPDELDVPYSTLLITSRPIASAALQQLASSCVEIVGFTPEEVSQYFQEVLKDPAAVQTLQEQLKDLPVIEASCYLPLNAVIVAHLFLGLNHSLPRTLHGVFSALVCGCIVRHVTKKSGETPYIPALDKLPSEVQVTFDNLCRLAYEASVKNKTTFTREDMSSYGVSVEGNGLGLMQGVQSFLSGKSDSYHFLHLSVQELLAAMHVSMLEAVDQVAAFRQLFSEPQLMSVFQFYAALTKLETEGIKEIVASVIMGSRPDNPHSSGRVQWRQYVLNILHCLYEAQDVPLCLLVASMLGGGLDLEGIFLSPLDCLCVGYFLCCVCDSKEGEFGVNLRWCGLDSYSVDFLVKELGKSGGCGGAVATGSSNTVVRCLGLDLGLNVIDGSGVHSVCELMMNDPSLMRKLGLGFNKKIQDNEDGLLCLLHILCGNCWLVKVDLYGCNLRISDESGPVLVEMLHKNVTLKELDLSGNAGIEMRYIAEGMVANNGIVSLGLWNCGIGEAGARLLGWMLSENRTLEHLEVSNNDIGDIGVGYIAEGMIANSGVVKLELEECGIGEEGSKSLGRMLTENRIVEHLDIGDNEIGDIGVGYIVQGMIANSVVLKLRLLRCGIGEKGGKLLGRMLKENRTLEHLDINLNEGLGDAGIMAIGEGLKGNCRLQELHMWACDYSLDCLKEFVLCLKKNSHLRRLKVDRKEVESLVEEREVVNHLRQQRGEVGIRIS